MSDTQTVANGVIRGKTIELEQESGLPDGQQVTVTIQPIFPEELAPGEGLRRAFGAWAEEAEEVDRYLEWDRQQRSIGRSEIEP